jgi:hypothetical protein
MQPIIPGVIKMDYASAYIVGMTDMGATLRGHIRTLINGLITDGLWSKLIYLGVAQNLEADTKRCLVRRASLFTPVGIGSSNLGYTANRGYFRKQTTNEGSLSSGYTPDPADLVLRDSHGLFSVFGALGVPDGFQQWIHGRYSTDTDAVLGSVTRSAGDLTQVLIRDLNMASDYISPTPVAVLSNKNFMYSARISASQVRGGLSDISTLPRTRVGTLAWGYSGYASIFHLGMNAHGAASEGWNYDGATPTYINAWGMTDGSLDAAQIANLRTRINTYLTALGL